MKRSRLSEIDATEDFALASFRANARALTGVEAMQASLEKSRQLLEESERVLQRTRNAAGYVAEGLSWRGFITPSPTTPIFNLLTSALALGPLAVDVAEPADISPAL